MNRAADSLAFVGQLLPVLVELGRDLFARHKGDLDGARAELRRIRDHGTQYADAHAVIKSEIEQLAEADTVREKPPK